MRSYCRRRCHQPISSQPPTHEQVSAHGALVTAQKKLSAHALRGWQRSAKLVQVLFRHALMPSKSRPGASWQLVPGCGSNLFATVEIDNLAAAGKAPQGHQLMPLHHPPPCPQVDGSRPGPRAARRSPPAFSETPRPATRSCPPNSPSLPLHHLRGPFLDAHFSEARKKARLGELLPLGLGEQLPGGSGDLPASVHVQLLAGSEATLLSAPCGPFKQKLWGNGFRRLAQAHKEVYLLRHFASDTCISHLS